MMLEPIGMATIVLGCLCLLASPRFAVAAMIPTMLLGSAAAVVIGGGGSIPPADLLLGFVTLTVFTHRTEAAEAMRAMRFPHEGFWLLCLTVFGVASAAIMPRVLAGVTDVNAIGTGSYEPSILLVPLGPVSGNVTQSIYMLADLPCFLAVVAIGRTREGLETIAKALLVYAGLNVVFAALDLATYATGTSELLGFMRNAQYTFHFDEEVNGMKRIAGSFTEASAFAGATMGITAFTSRLWLAGRWTAATGPLALVSLCLLLASTSSTAIVGIVPTLLALYAIAIRTMGDPRRGRAALSVVLAAPALALLVALGIAMSHGATTAILDYVDVMVLNKANSASGMERAAWNAAALRNFAETHGIGGGLGSIRSSSFVVAVASNLGVVGLALFTAFFACVFAWPREREDGGDALAADLRSAGRVSCFGLLCTAATSGTLVELGLPFYLLAGVACATPKPKVRESATADVGTGRRALDAVALQR